MLDDVHDEFEETLSEFWERDEVVLNLVQRTSAKRLKNRRQEACQCLSHVLHHCGEKHKHFWVASLRMGALEVINK